MMMGGCYWLLAIGSVCGMGLIILKRERAKEKIKQITFAWSKRFFVGIFFLLGELDFEVLGGV